MKILNDARYSHLRSRRQIERDASHPAHGKIGLAKSQESGDFIVYTIFFSFRVF